jgi:hypothetical protein
MTDFPFARDPDRCDLCSRRAGAGALVRVELEPAEKTIRPDGRVAYRCSRAAWVCGAHDERSQGRPVATPSTTTAPGSSSRRPQGLALFDDTALIKVGGRR